LLETWNFVIQERRSYPKLSAIETFKLIYIFFPKVTARALPHLEEDDRLLPMLCGLSKRYLGQDFNAKKTNVGQVTADMIDMV